MNTKIKLTIVHKGSDKPIEVTIVRDIIRVKSVRSRAEGEDVGYIRITQFNEQTTAGLKYIATAALTRLQPLIPFSMLGFGVGIPSRGDDAQSIYSFRAATCRHDLDQAVFHGDLEPRALPSSIAQSMMLKLANDYDKLADRAAPSLYCARW